MCKRLLLLLLTVLLLTGCALAETRIMVVSDVHYLAKELYDGSDYFLAALARGDGKASMYSDEMAQALVEEALHQQPELLVITGDLTFNGERASHEALAAILRGLTEKGVRVAVIPGNHDINNRSAAHYLADGYEWTDQVDSAAFRAIWTGLAADELTGPGSCGVVKVNDRVWVVMGDYSVYEGHNAAYGDANAEHLAWMQRVTEAAAETGPILISTSHQAMFPHVDFMEESFMVWGGDKLTAMLREAGCELNLSGHMHIQHILRHESITDIATGAWSMSPHRYGIVTIGDDGSIEYQAYGVCKEHLGDEAAQATRAYFRWVTMEKLRPSLDVLSLSQEDYEQMLQYAADVNEAYFAGTTAEQPELMDAPGRALWLDVGAKVSFGAYLNARLDEAVEDALHWSNR